MSDNARIDEALEYLGKIIGVDLTPILDGLYEDVELAKVAFVKRQKEDREAREQAKAEDFTDVKAAMFDFGVDKTAPAPDAKGDLWEVAIRDTYNSVVEIRADKVQFGPFAGHDIGFTAYLNGDVVFQAPAGTYYYAKKVVE